MFIRNIAVSLMLVSCMTASVAQSVSTVNREFWLSFISNAFYDASAFYGGEPPPWAELQKAELSIILSSNSDAIEPIEGKIEIAGTSQPFSLLPGEAKTVKLATDIAEVESANVIQRKGIKITSEGDITVYASSGMTPYPVSGGAAMILPSSMLGTEYYVPELSSYWVQCWKPHTPPGYPDGSQFSQLLALATVDDTEVIFTFKSGATRMVTLDAGEAYKITDGIRVVSIDKCKPIAVFSGHGYARFPLMNDCSRNGDMLFEQALPLEYMGNEYYINPIDGFINRYQLVALDGDTQVEIREGLSTSSVTVNASGHLLTTLSQPSVIRSDKPILVAHLGPSSASGSTNEFDPFEVTMLPKELGTKSLAFSRPVEPYWTKHVLSVIAPESSVGDAKLNGKSISAAFSPFPPDPSLSYAEILLDTLSRHYKLEMPGKFYAYVYGFGYAYMLGAGMNQGYGYPAGAHADAPVNTAQIDFNAETPACTGKDIQFTAMPNVLYDPDQFSWSFGDGNTSSLKNPSHTYAVPGTYAVRLVTTYVCGTKTLKDSVTRTIEITDEAVISANAGDDIVLCKGDFAQLHASGGTKYHWTPDYKITDVNSQNPYINPSVSTQYIVTVSDSTCSGQDTDTVFVKVIKAPKASFTHSKEDLIVHVQATGGNDMEIWEWDMGDGSVFEGGANESYPYLDYGTYMVKLRISNICGADSTFQEIVIDGTTSAEAFLEHEIFSAAVYPNPIGEQDLVLITESLLEQQVELIVYDFLGRAHHRQALEIPAKHARHRLKKESLFTSPGMYILELKGTSFSSFLKISVL